MKTVDLDLPNWLKESFLDSGITDLNPPQSKAVKNGVMDGEDMIVASPTASGKTFIAELAIAEQVIKNEGKAVYIVPLKALASEKYQDFNERYGSLNVRKSVGDLDEGGKGLETADIIIATSEKLDSLLRHNPGWIHEINLVVTDEIHLLTSPNRGPTLEVTLTRLRDLLDFQHLGLSATISNSDSLADWMDAELVESNYRPVKLEEGVYFNQTVEFNPETKKDQEENKEDEDDSGLSGFKTGKEIMKTGGKDEESDDEAEEIDSSRELNLKATKGKQPTEKILNNTLEMEKQCIIFCNSRKGAEKESDRAAKHTKNDLTRQEQKELERYAERIRNVLGNPTSQCKRLAENVEKGAAFHHAGLVNEQRNYVEEAFKEGLIRSISATPTLAAGVNLPAFRVVIRDLKRYTGDGMDYIPVLEYEQMTGRAGRPKYDDRGEAISIGKNPGMVSEVVERYIEGEPERIQSKLAAEPVLRMHTLSLIASRFCTDMEELLEFYSKTFYAYQYGDMKEVEKKIKGVVAQLRDYEFLKEGVLKPTKVGKRVSELYIDPDSANHILQCLSRADEMKENGEEIKPVSYLFMLSQTSEMQPSPNVKNDEWQDIEQALMDAEPFLLEDIPKEWDPGYDGCISSMKATLMMQAWISELDEERIMEKYGVAPGGIRARMNNADWLLYGSKELSRMKDFSVESDLEKLRLRLQHGIKEELLNLVSFNRIGRVRARKLYKHGIHDQEDIREVSFEKLKHLIGKKTGQNLKKQVGEENIFDRENIMDYFDE